ncbi:MAG: T9SS type A sorting domain-containing protein [Chitinophagales bacterium]
MKNLISKAKASLLLVLFCSSLSSYAQSLSATVSATRVCNGDGTATVTPTGGTAPYTYLWSNGATAATATGLLPGYYEVTITDAMGATIYSYAQVTQLVYVTKSTVDEICPPGGNAEVTANPTGGAAPYTYLWSNGSTLQHLTGLTGNQAYQLSVTVTDVNGCISYNGDSSQSNGPSFYVYTYDSGATCPLNNGSMTAYVYGGVPPYSYHWSNGSNASHITGLAPGRYYVTVTDANGCEAVVMPYGSDSVHSYAAFYMSATVTNEQCGNGAGAIVSSLNGSGTPPYVYNWNTGQTSHNLSSLHAGNYVLSVSDANGCMAYPATFTVANGSPINVSISHIDEHCNTGNGSVTVVANGGATPYTYHWNTGSTATSINSLHSGSYMVTVRDNNNCSTVSGVYVYSNSPIAPNVTKVDESCTNGHGSATANPTLGTAPYTYVWSNGATTASISNLHQGYYTVTIHDAAGCTVNGYSYINNTSPISPNGTYVPPVCDNLNGSVTVAPTGGTAPYTYIWNTSPVATTASITGLGVGFYSCLITDHNGCTNQYNTYLPYNSTMSVNVTHTNVVCPNTNGSVGLSVSGGSLPYSYNWNTGATSNFINGLAAGTYTVTIHDVNNCTVVKSATVYSTSPVHLALTHANASCVFTADGSATVVATGGTAPYAYQWQNGQTTATSTGLAPTWYYGVYVTDANGCSNHDWTNIGYNSTACAITLCGNLIEDINGNCVQESGEYGISNVMMQAVPGDYTYTDNSGHFSILEPTGNYSLQQIVPQYYNQICPNPNPLINASVADSAYCHDFFDHTLDSVDMRISWCQLTAARPGFQSEMELYYFNDGTRGVNDTVVFKYAPEMTFNSATQGPLYIDAVNHKVGFSINSPVHGANGNLKLFFDIAPATPLGTLLNCQASAGNYALIVKDPTPLNNVEARVLEVVGSFDPNDKSVTPKGIGAHGIIQRSDSILNYTIRFQNTGTFKAENVVVADTLDANLDVTSIKPGAASHPYQLEFRGKNILLIKFLNIQLPDSNQNEKESHGVVTFYIKMKKNLPDGTQFHNKAAIYFDYNRPVITNTTENSLIKYNGIAEVADNVLQVYPNPANDQIVIESTFDKDETLELYDMLGHHISDVVLKAGSKNRMDVSLLTDGVYLFKTQHEGASYTARFMKIGSR